MPDFTGTSGHQNREMGPSYYSCHVHHDAHEAECFVLIFTSEGAEGIPVCNEAAPSLIAALSDSPGIRGVCPTSVPSFHGVIFGNFINK